ncbi:hypothetical protein E2C01_067175 [Portunus trituberculatus]|uniref:Uncharacterized protein n=1 Tax=Portunus trituberculatus TaxID=210409 RepID=A0A5B7HJ45_PORTR|nr:hypothetical protein [Portunus trituberculatus]
MKIHARLVQTIAALITFDALEGDSAGGRRKAEVVVETQTGGRRKAEVIVDTQTGGRREDRDSSRDLDRREKGRQM